MGSKGKCRELTTSNGSRATPSDRNEILQTNYCSTIKGDGRVDEEKTKFFLEASEFTAASEVDEASWTVTRLTSDFHDPVRPNVGYQTVVLKKRPRQSIMYTTPSLMHARNCEYKTSVQTVG